MNRQPAIVVLDGYTLNPGDNPWTPVERLGRLTVYDTTPPEEIVRRAADADVILTNKTPLRAETLDRLPKLRYIGMLATGYDVVDVKAARRRGVPVTNVPEYGADSVAEHVFALLLALCRRPERHDQLVRDGEWTRRGQFCFWSQPLRELRGKTIGIVGFGRIGRRVGRLAHAFGMPVLAYDVRQADPPGYEPFRWRPLPELAAESDVVTLHCPLTADNAGMVDRKFLERMKPSALLINAARGALVNERDLAEALNAGRIAGAAVDVASTEPIRDENPLLSARNCVITPHIGWATVEARRRLMRAVADNLQAFLAGQPKNVVNEGAPSR